MTDAKYFDPSQALGEVAKDDSYSNLSLYSLSDFCSKYSSLFLQYDECISLFSLVSLFEEGLNTSSFERMIILSKKYTRGGGYYQMYLTFI